MIIALYENEDDRNYAKKVVKTINWQKWHPLDFNDIQASTDVYEFCYNHLKEKADFIREVEDI